MQKNQNSVIRLSEAQKITGVYSGGLLQTLLKTYGVKELAIGRYRLWYRKDVEEVAKKMAEQRSIPIAQDEPEKEGKHLGRYGCKKEPKDTFFSKAWRDERNFITVASLYCDVDMAQKLAQMALDKGLSKNAIVYNAVVAALGEYDESQKKTPPASPANPYMSRNGMFNESR